VDRDEVMAWVSAYERAWRDGDAGAVATLFTTDAHYLDSPYEPPKVGHAAIAADWVDPRPFTMNVGSVVVDGEHAVVRVLVSYADPPQEYTDLWVLDFAADRRVARFEEWAYWPGRSFTSGPWQRFQQVNLVVSDLADTVRFVRLLGWEVEHPGYPHLEVGFGPVSVEFDEVEAARRWHAATPGAGSGGAVVTLAVPDRAGVDAAYDRVTAAGYPGPQPPVDAFWGSRFAVVADGDGNQFGLMSPRR
jgi:catechol 2,3-dioxygenase-like lactoylglutathione lyase family enzyme